MNKRMQYGIQLLANIKENSEEIGNLLFKLDKKWGLEDYFYRLYHHSFKTYAAQSTTEEIVELLKKLDPKEEPALNPMFLSIVYRGTGKKWESDHNGEWEKHTVPMLQALFHARYFLELAHKYGGILEKAPNTLPSGWAAVLYLYCIR